MKKYEAIKRMLKQESGLILVTGPTGSGKTTTLYAMLNALLKDNKGTIISLEDPVESVIKGVRQTPIRPDAGLTFEKGLRAILRQDPDVIMVGEIRDKETAKIALNAAYTGHLVVSSLHTDDVQSTMMRLSSFGLDPFLLSYSLKGIISQKLVKSSKEVKRTLNAEVLSLNKHAVEQLSDIKTLLELGEHYPFSDG